jgi:hypothetical protein
MKGRAATGPFPLYRGKTGSKHHVIVEAYGIPLATILTGGNRHDVTQLLPLIEAVPPIRGRPRRRPGHLYTDRVCRRDRVTFFGCSADVHPTTPGRGDRRGSRQVVRWP